jgi:hypothetical protein
VYTSYYKPQTLAWLHKKVALWISKALQRNKMARGEEEGFFFR